jgi:hypothetical protein
VPSLNFKVWGDGTHQQWSALVGESEGYLCVDDSDDSSHDSDDTYLTLRGPGERKISFPILVMAEISDIASIALRVAAKIDSGLSSPPLRIGFYRNGSSAVSGTTFSPTTSYTVATWTWTTDPITGEAWTQEGLARLEAYIENTAGFAGINRITLVSGAVSYRLPTFDTTAR